MSRTPIPTVGVVTFKDNAVLLVKHTSHGGHITDTYGLPAGRIEIDATGKPLESVKQAAMRELSEETGYQVNEEDLIEFEDNHYTADIPRNDGTTKKMTWTVFLAKELSGEMKSSEDTVPEWVELETLESLPLVANVANAIHAAVEHKNKKMQDLSN